ncbi:formyltetrahydrofolate deformylase [Motiliproteus coralliicola]|uniref:Formyltetrahydrofolate deformylase n=1 Tax=Motiliproteus coralliicola TaxID=2283196 RepID=A0A369WVN1_9GAMM|nr:formyltetrahydrofolate deformylase [Motiliproteus coralliicola]RDE24606.1 formyltetrahydrofolate deformylase [Motiliproteus coralliicola]
MSRKNKPWILNADCPSQLGTVDVVTRFLAESRNYVGEIHSFDDKEVNHFSMRVEFHPLDEDFDAEQFNQQFAERAAAFDMQWQLTAPDHKSRVAIMVSKYDHCLHDLLYHYRTGELAIEIPVIISNHPDLEDLAKWHGIPYHHLPITAETKPEQEKQVWELVQQYDCELVVLARYMQVLSDDLCEKLSGRAINIHHSLLPGFKGAKPYHQAWEKGVKLVGATAHYVNSDLDEGPIIAQGVQAVDHSHYPEDLVAKGQHIESLTLTRAVRYHIEKRVFLHGQRTVVFPD